MGILFGGWWEEEAEEWKSSGLSWEEFQAKKKYERENIVYKPIKKARFRGVELQELDMITNNLNGDRYIIRDFQEDARPIVDLISFSKSEVNIPYPFEEVYLIKSAI